MAVLGGPPAIAIRSDAEVSALAKRILPVFISATSVQADPFHDSVFAVTPGGASPPKTRPAVVDPPPHRPFFAVFISAISVHDVPLYCSTTSTLFPAAFSHPAPIAAV